MPGTGMYHQVHEQGPVIIRHHPCKVIRFFGARRVNRDVNTNSLEYSRPPFKGKNPSRAVLGMDAYINGPYVQCSACVACVRVEPCAAERFLPLSVSCVIVFCGTCLTRLQLYQVPTSCLCCLHVTAVFLGTDCLELELAHFLQITIFAKT